MNHELLAKDIASGVKTYMKLHLDKQRAELHAQMQEAIKAAVPAPLKGEPGNDGLGFDDMEISHDGERVFQLKFTKGDRGKTFDFSIPAVIDRGVYQDIKYERGDAVTFGGSLWIAQRANPDGKPGQSDGWRLAVKRGRDGK